MEKELKTVPDWCFWPDELQESEESYDCSGDVNFDYEAGHFDDYRSVRSVAGAYMRQDFVAVIIPEGIKIIPEKAFAFCENLKYVYVPDSVTLIEGGAFAGCKKLVEVSLPKRIEIKERCHEWWHEYEWNPYDDREHDDDYYYETFEDWSCLKYREQPLSADEWLERIKKTI